MRQREDLAFSPWSSGAESEVFEGLDAEKHREANGESPSAAPIRLREAYARYVADVRPSRAPRTRSDSWCIRIWRARFNERIVHHDGLTDAILAHSLCVPWRPGHYKMPMDRMAADLAAVQSEHGWGRGTHRKAVEAGTAADWIAANLDAIELLERKIYNRHDLLENLALAFTRVPKIVPPESPE